MNLQKLTAFGTALALLLGLTACQSADSSSQTGSGPEQAILLSDEGITLDGQTVTEDSQSPVTVSHDIIYYQSGMGSDYGEGPEAEAHSTEEAQAHTVVTIRQPGTYRVSGALSAGQLAVDLGEDAKTNPDAVVTLILDTVWWFKHVTMIWVLTSGGPGSVTNTISVEIYKQAFEYSGKYGYSAALAVIVFLICVLIGVLQRKVLTRNDA